MSNIVEIKKKVKKFLESENIPWGKLTCYESLGVRLGTSSQNIGQACYDLGRKYSLRKIPCHRIIHKNGYISFKIKPELRLKYVNQLKREKHKIIKKESDFLVEDFEDCLET